MKQIGLDFTIRTSICIVISSAMIDLLEFYIPPFHGDIILTVVFGGVLSGGLGLIYMRGGTTGHRAHSPTCQASSNMFR